MTTATSIRVRNGRRQITDGPFAETTEQFGGYYIVDVEKLDEAIAIAARLPPAKKGTVEIRPIFELPDFPVSIVPKRRRSSMFRFCPIRRFFARFRTRSANPC